MKHLTIRDVPAELAEALEAEKARRGESLNETVKQLLRQGLGLVAEAGGRYDNGLGQFAGTWSAADLEEFERATEVFEKIDDELWK